MLKVFLLPKFLHPIIDLITRICLRSVYPKSIYQKFKELGITKNPKLVQTLMSETGAFGVP